MPTNLAKAGNRVTLNFVTSFPIIGDPTVIFKSGGQVVNNNINYTNSSDDDRTWTAFYDVDSTDNDGVVSFTISGTDYAGKNRDFTFTTPSPGVTVDTTPPNLDHETPIGITNDTTPSYVFTSSEDGTLSSTLAFTSPNPAVVTTGSNTITFDTLSDATYTGKIITVTDAAGNASNLTIPQFVIDTIPPTAAITYSSAGPYRENATTTITATFTESLTTTPKINISGVSTISQDMSGSGKIWTYGYTAPSGNGTEIITLSAGTDAAGNEVVAGPTSGSTFTVDNTAPTASITYSPAGPYKENATTTITATFTESLTTTPKINISGVSSISQDMSGSGTTWTYSYTAPSGNGTETITLSVGTDAAGNEVVADPTSGSTFTVDNTAPTATIAYSSAAPYKENDSVTITATFTESLTTTPKIAISGVSSINATDMSGSGTTWTYSYTAPAGDGTETISLSAGTDAAGNEITAVPTNNTFTVDNTAPTATIAYSTTGPYKENDSVTITATFTESLTTTPKIAISGVSSINATDMSGSGTTWTYSYTAPAGDGTETISLSAGTDAAGNEVVADPTNNTFTVDNTAPIFSSVSATGGYYKENDIVTINVNFDEAVKISTTPSLNLSNGETVNYSSGTGSDTLKFDYTVGAANTENTTNLQVTSMSGTIKDSAGNTFSGTVSGPLENVVIDNIKPTTTNGFTMSQSGSINYNTEVTVNIVFSEPIKEEPIVDNKWYNNITTSAGNNLGGSFGTWSTTDGGKTWTATFTAGNSMTSSRYFILLAQYIVDLAGNIGSDDAEGVPYEILNEGAAGGDDN